MQNPEDFLQHQKLTRFDLNGKTAIVTGGAGAIGSAVAQGLAEHGADVAVLDLQEQEAANVKERIRKIDRRSISIGYDLHDSGQVEQAVAQVVKDFGHIDILIHTAGYGVLGPLLEMTREDFEENLAVFVSGAFVVSQLVAKEMVRTKSGGSIVHISSIVSTRAMGRGTGAYAAAKAGLNALVRESAVEWAPHGIRVNAVAPCQVKTPSLDRLLDSGLHGGREALEEKMTSKIPLGRLGEPEEIVGPCIFLASDAASLITGHVLFADGGYTAQ